MSHQCFRLRVFAGKGWLFAKNVFMYLHSVLPYFGNIWIKGFAVLAVIAFPLAAVRYSKRPAVFSAGMAVALLALMLVLSQGAYLILTHPFFAARTFIGFDVLLAIIAVADIAFVGNTKKLVRLHTAIILCLVYGMGINVTVYGNVIQKQKEYEQFRFAILLQDLSHIIDPSVRNSIYIGGITGIAGKTRMEQKNYPMAPGG